MEIKLTKDWNRRHGIIKKGTVLEVTTTQARILISEKRARPVRDNFFTRHKSVQDDGTKQTRRKVTNKKKEKADGDNREI